MSKVEMVEKQEFDWAELSALLQARVRCYRVCGVEDREDVCQDILLRLLVHGALPRQDRRNWVGAVVSNGAKDLLRRQKREGRCVDRGCSIDTIGLELEEKIEERVRQVAASAAQEAELRQAVWQEVERLPEVQRQVCAMVAKGLKYREMAQEMGCAIGTIRSRFHHARARLRAELRKNGF